LSSSPERKRAAMEFLFPFRFTTSLTRHCAYLSAEYLRTGRLE
jgi:hypothetical protein